MKSGQILESILVISIISAPIVIPCLMLCYWNYREGKRHEKWIENFKKKHLNK